MAIQRHPRLKREYAPGVAARNHIIYGYERKALKSGVAFTLTIDECEKLFKESCFYCGIAPKQVCFNKSMNGTYTYNGLDRKTSIDGYTLNNVVSCCKRCNLAKGPLTMVEFIEYIERVIAYAQI